MLVSTDKLTNIDLNAYWPLPSDTILGTTRFLAAELQRFRSTGSGAAGRPSGNRDPVLHG
jgi:hypothetical protein